ncbi:tol-pal system-associated acyl-CoA thioesterase [Acidisphaera sp. L21]|uniref:tol-pal system-associated acyl-CoA thioesterase n=1 Tax=Acidisphaera sp. L21 TaxID=1641851 RepID=UPI001576CCFD|nr:tol-pal system-associated acyl-CoA thioesterase [Acidisphaera sp. L21]
MIRHRLDIRVYFEDTDAGGVVYHARYLAFAERARTEFLRDYGVPHEQMVREEGLIFVVRRVKMDYLRPARLDDLVTVTTEPTELGAATASLRQEFAVGDLAVARLDVQLACVRGADGRPSRIPVRWRTALEEMRSG